MTCDCSGVSGRRKAHCLFWKLHLPAGPPFSGGIGVNQQASLFSQLSNTQDKYGVKWLVWEARLSREKCWHGQETLCVNQQHPSREILQLLPISPPTQHTEALCGSAAICFALALHASDFIYVCRITGDLVTSWPGAKYIFAELVLPFVDVALE